jgi:predicted nucleotidyltransferase
MSGLMLSCERTLSDYGDFRRKGVERDQIIRILSEQRSAFDRLGIESLSLFGSVVRGEDRPESDVDILVKFKSKATFDRFMELKFLLEDLLGGRVDLVTRKALRPSMRPGIEQEAIRVA